MPRYSILAVLCLILSVLLSGCSVVEKGRCFFDPECQETPELQFAKGRPGSA